MACQKNEITKGQTSVIGPSKTVPVDGEVAHKLEGVESSYKAHRKGGGIEIDARGQKEMQWEERNPKDHVLQILQRQKTRCKS